MEYRTNINGIEVVASYSEKSVNAILIPLLRHLSAIHSKGKKRIIVMLAAPPALGKAHLSAFWKAWPKISFLRKQSRLWEWMDFICNRTILSRIELM